MRDLTALRRSLIRVGCLQIALAMAVAGSRLWAQGLPAAVPASDQGVRAKHVQDGVMHVPAFDLPLSEFLSAEARDAQKKINANGGAMAMDEDPTPMAAKLAAMRPMFAQMTKPALDQALKAYPVTTRSERWGDVPVVVVTPQRGVQPRHRKHLLINLHSGGFALGDAANTGVIESAPIAAKMGVVIVTVDYRLGPEHHFPAASEDVAAVYRHALEHYRAKDIGLYGCSAGGMLTAEALAWFQKEKLPTPAAAGLFCAGADAAYGGDSSFTVQAISGGRIPRPGVHMPVLEDFYYAGADMKDPLVSPVYAPAVLRKFPPTLIVTATRAPELSSAVHTHSQLVKFGVDARLHVWEGLEHGFFTQDLSLPESAEVFDVVAAFFEKHLD